MTPRLLLLGATHGTGLHVLKQALARGHQVTALVRDPARLTVTSDHLRVLTGDVTADDTALSTAMQGQDVVISTIGRGLSFKSNGLMAAATPRIVRAMEARGVRRLIFTSGFGVGETWRDTPFLARLFAATLLRGIYADKTAGEVHIRRSALDWTLVYPVGLNDKPATSAYRAGARLALSGFPTMPRADVADFLLSQIDDTNFIRKGVLVAS